MEPSMVQMRQYCVMDFMMEMEFIESVLCHPLKANILIRFKPHLAKNVKVILQLQSQRWELMAQCVLQILIIWLTRMARHIIQLEQPVMCGSYRAMN